MRPTGSDLRKADRLKAGAVKPGTSALKGVWSMSDLPLGPPVDPRPAPWPERIVLEGRDVDLEPLSASRHGALLFEATAAREHDSLWTYMFDGPFADRPVFDAALERLAASQDPLYYAIVDRGTRHALGRAALMRIEPVHRVIEVGSIVYSPRLQRTRAATEAMYLLARYVFESLGYRRYEWKCHALNEPSRSAAVRLGFTFEGIFRQHMIVKGRNRDTAWYSMLDSEWPARKARFERWLAPGNFDANGRQRTPLAAS
jgi:RimJ/RimL family protein N-acetyltransferase